MSVSGTVILHLVDHIAVLRNIDSETKSVDFLQYYMYHSDIKVSLLYSQEKRKRKEKKRSKFNAL